MAQFSRAHYLECGAMLYMKPCKKFYPIYNRFLSFTIDKLKRTLISTYISTHIRLTAQNELSFENKLNYRRLYNRANQTVIPFFSTTMPSKIIDSVPEAFA